jgi:AhpC/TSA family
MKVLSVLFALFVSATAFGATVAPFQLPWMNHATPGTIYKSADHPNTVFVLEAYFRSCSYCNANAPLVDDLAESYADNARVQVIDLGIDKYDNDYRIWIANHQPNHPVLKDANRVVVTPLGTTAYPTTYVVDCNMNVVYRSVGGWSSIAPIQQAVDAALAACPVGGEQ